MSPVDLLQHFSSPGIRIHWAAASCVWPIVLLERSRKTWSQGCPLTTHTHDPWDRPSEPLWSPCSLETASSVCVVLGLKWEQCVKPCPTLCNLMDYSQPSSSVHGILQERILMWVVIPFSRGSSWPKDGTRVSHTAGRFFTVWAPREAPKGKRDPQILQGLLTVLVRRGFSSSP